MNKFGEELIIKELIESKLRIVPINFHPFELPETQEFLGNFANLASQAIALEVSSLAENYSKTDRVLSFESISKEKILPEWDITWVEFNIGANNKVISKGGAIVVLLNLLEKEAKRDLVNRKNPLVQGFSIDELDYVIQIHPFSKEQDALLVFPNIARFVINKDGFLVLKGDYETILQYSSIRNYEISEKDETSCNISIPIYEIVLLSLISKNHKEQDYHLEVVYPFDKKLVLN